MEGVRVEDAVADVQSSDVRGVWLAVGEDGGESGREGEVEAPEANGGGGGGGGRCGRHHLVPDRALQRLRRPHIVGASVRGAGGGADPSLDGHDGTVATRS